MNSLNVLFDVIFWHIRRKRIDESNDFIEVSLFGTHSLIINDVPNVRLSAAPILSAIKGTKLTFIHSQNHKRRKIQFGKMKISVFCIAAVGLLSTTTESMTVKRSKDFNPFN